MAKNFRRQWSNQTNLGKIFGLSAIAIGKILISNKLKNASTKYATPKALNEGYAISTPLKDGTPYFMWNINKVKQLVSQDHKELSKVDYWVAEVKGIFLSADHLCEEGNDKIGYLMLDTMYDEVPSEIRNEVKTKVEADRKA